MTTRETVEVCSGDTAARWQGVQQAPHFKTRETSPLLASYVEGLRLHRLAAIVAGDYLEFKKYVASCGLQPEHVRYIVTADKITQNSLVIRTGTFWNRSDRDTLDRRMHSMHCRVFDDWPT